MRKQYSPQEYARLTAELERIISDTPTLEPDRNTWDLEGDWLGTGTILFVDAEQQLRFERYKEFDCRTIKLINLGRPAVRITFYNKHKYWLKKEKDLLAEEKEERITAYLNGLLHKIDILADKLNSQTPEQVRKTRQEIVRLQQETDVWRNVLANLDSFELALSTYRRGYSYLYINWKFKLPSGDYENQKEHLLNHQRDKLGNITQEKTNIVFVDPEEIKRFHPSQNKEIELYLAKFPLRTEFGVPDIYVRPRVEGML